MQSNEVYTNTCEARFQSDSPTLPSSFSQYMYTNTNHYLNFFVRILFQITNNTFAQIPNSTHPLGYAVRICGLSPTGSHPWADARWLWHRNCCARSCLPMKRLQKTTQAVVNHKPRDLHLDNRFPFLFYLKTTQFKAGFH